MSKSKSKNSARFFVKEISLNSWGQIVPLSLEEISLVRRRAKKCEKFLTKKRAEFLLFGVSKNEY